MNSEKTVKLGKAGPEVFRLGLGCMGMSGMYGETDERESIATIHAALEHGPLLVDTGDFYGMGHNEQLVGKAIAGRRDRAVVSVKFGALRGPDGKWLGFDARPVALKAFAAYSLNRLGVEVIDVYRPSRLDPQVPIEETVGAIADLIKAGYVRHIGLSEVGVDTIRRAQAVHPIVDLQIEYSIASRSPEARLFPALHELGLSATLYGVFSRGLLTGSRPKGSRDFRFTGDAANRNEDLAAKFAKFANERGMTPAQLAVAWVLAKEPGFVPLLGAKTRAQLRDGFAALEKPLSPSDSSELEALIPNGAFQGNRYAAEQMRFLDSER
jgi:aryl-alcohol dehydrogenase-like predicted oxidoreductase